MDCSGNNPKKNRKFKKRGTRPYKKYHGKDTSRKGFVKATEISNGISTRENGTVETLEKKGREQKDTETISSQKRKPDEYDIDLDLQVDSTKKSGSKPSANNTKRLKSTDHVKTNNDTPDKEESQKSNIIRIPKDLLPENITSGVIMSIDHPNQIPQMLEQICKGIDSSSMDETDSRRIKDKNQDKTDQGKTPAGGDKGADDDDNEDESDGSEEHDDDEDDSDGSEEHDDNEDERSADRNVTHEMEDPDKGKEPSDIDLSDTETLEDHSNSSRQSSAPYFTINRILEVDSIPKHLLPIDNIQKIITLGHLFRHPSFKYKNYSINIKGLHAMIPALQKLNHLVGLTHIKKKLIDQIMFFSQDLHNQEWYYHQHQKLRHEECSRHGGTGREMDFGNSHRGGPRHPLETLLQIIPLGPRQNPPKSDSSGLYWAGGGATGGAGSREGRGGRVETGRGGSREGRGVRGPGGREKRRGKCDKPRRQDVTLDHENPNPQKGLDPHLCDDTTDMLHTVIAGPPGVGKTVFGKILADIYLSLGITSRDTFKIVRRSDLVGEYLGQTAVKTQKAIDSALGGVLFIDEAYSLGCNDGRRKSDSFSKECIDTINQNLSEKKGQFICIIAGYPEELEQHFFSVNPGLKRRFSFHYHIEGYDWEELTEILCRKIEMIGWKLDPKSKEWLFDPKKGLLKTHVDQFPHFGGDIETLLLNIKIVHGRRVFGLHPDYHKVITRDDILQGFERYQTARGVKKKEESVNNNMYL